MEEGKKKEGVSVKEIESYARHHRFEIFFCILFILASLFTLIFWGPVLSILLTGVGAVISVLFLTHIEKLSHAAGEKIFKQAPSTLMIVGIIALIVAIFLPPIVFLLIGLHAGKSLIRMAKRSQHQ